MIFSKRSGLAVIPTYDQLFYPVMQLLKNGESKRTQELYVELIEYLKLDREEVEKQRSKSGKVILYDRLSWARTYLVKAGVIESVKRGVVRITDEGVQFLNNLKRPVITNEDLRQYDSFEAFRYPHSDTNDRQSVADKGFSHEEELISDQTPEEQIEESFYLYKEQVKEELLERILANHPRFFEYLVVELIVAMGYGGSSEEAGETLQYSNDGGIDGIIKEDVLGLDHIYLQAKRWKDVVTRPEIQRFSGSLDGQRAKKGIFITTSKFSQGAIDYVQQIDKKIILLDGEQLTEYMYRYNIGVSTTRKIILKQIDTDFFIDSM